MLTLKKAKKSQINHLKTYFEKLQRAKASGRTQYRSQQKSNKSRIERDKSLI